MKTFALRSDNRLSGYDYLSQLSCDRWAWEYLRRNRAFRRDAIGREASDVSEKKAACADIRLLKSRVPQTRAERWGLVVMPDPALNGFDADVIWNRAVFPDQIEVNCSARGADQTCEIFARSVAICKITHLTDNSGREYLLVRGKGCVVQVRCSGLSLIGLEPVRMDMTISDIDAFERKVKAQKEAIRITGSGPEQIAPRWTKRTKILRDGLVALDCLETGMTRRQIAGVLYGEKVAANEWDSRAMRHAMRYLVKKAEALRDGGYLVELLGCTLTPVQETA